MSNMKYNGVVSIQEQPHDDDAGKPLKILVEVEKFPVCSFSVEGGTSRSIDLDSASSISIGNEFGQARTYNNITLFLPPKKDFTAAKLFSLRSGGLRFFTMLFQVNVFAGGVRIETLILLSTNAWLRRNPIPVGNKQALLMLDIGFNQVEILHGRRNLKSRTFVHKEI